MVNIPYMDGMAMAFSEPFSCGIYCCLVCCQTFPDGTASVASAEYSFLAPKAWQVAFQKQDLRGSCPVLENFI